MRPGTLAEELVLSGSVLEPYGRFSVLRNGTAEIRYFVSFRELTCGAAEPIPPSYSRVPPQQPQQRRSLPSQIAQKRRNPGTLVLGTPAPWLCAIGADILNSYPSLKRERNGAPIPWKEFVRRAKGREPPSAWAALWIEDPRIKVFPTHRTARCVGHPVISYFKIQKAANTG